MDNPYASKSSAQAAAFALTLAMVEKMDFGNHTSTSSSPAAKGKKAAEFVNSFYNDVLANLDRK